MSKPQVFINGESVKGWQVIRTAQFTRPRYARFPHWLRRLLERFGVATMEEKQVNLLVTTEAPTTKTIVAMLYKTDYENDTNDETTC